MFLIDLDTLPLVYLVSLFLFWTLQTYFWPFKITGV